MTRVRRKTTGFPKPPSGALSFQVKITLEGIEPPVWRRLVIPADLTLDALHVAIQAAMGWTESHMHQFHVGKARYGDQRLLDDDGFDCRDEAGITVADVARQKAAFSYEYDFGDGWMHRIEFERAPDPEGVMARPVCTGGARACPPEDCGGPWGYQDLLEAIFDPQHEEHDSLLEWLGDSFDPEAFDVGRVNATLARLFRRRRGSSAPSKARAARRAGGVNPVSAAPASGVLAFFEEAASSEEAPAPEAGPQGAGPDEQAPSLEEWRRLYAAAAAFKEAEAWSCMLDGDLFGVQNPEDGQTGYCCVVGALGQFQALAVYRGAAGLASWRRIQAEGRKRHVDTELYFGQDCLTASWESRSSQERRDLHILKALGLKFRGAQAWPLFRDYVPGCCPWFLAGRQARFLARALEQAKDVAQRCRKDPMLLAPRGDRLLVRVCQSAHGQEAWEDRWLPAESAPLPPGVLEPLDEVRLARIAQKCARVDGVWQADRFHLFTPVAGAGRPFYPALFLAVDAAFQVVVGQGMDHPRDGLAPVRAHLLEAMETSGAIPRELWVKRTEVFESLRPLAERLGIGLLQKKGLRELDAARKGLERALGVHR